MGLGVGIRKWFYKGGGGESIIPVYVNFRSNLGYNKYQKVYPYIQSKFGFPILNQSVGIAFKNIPLTFCLYGEVFPIIIAGLYINFGMNIGITF